MAETEITNPYIIQFPALNWEFEINPTAITVFGLSIQWYGIIIAFGLMLAVLYCFPRMKKFGINSDSAVDAVIGGVIGGVVGARLYFVAMKWDEYKQDTLKDTFLAVINTRNGGLAIYGGIIGALIVGLTICKIKKIKMFPMLDISLMGFLIGQGIGRWGNFVNQEAFGINTDSIFGMTGGRIQQIILRETQIGGSMYENGINMMWEKPVHPCFLYESVWCLLGFAVLALYSKHRKYDGQLTLMYMAWYGAERAVVEGLRIDSLMIGNVRVSQLVSVIILIVSVILQIVIGLNVKRDPEKYVLYVNTEESKLMLKKSVSVNTENDDKEIVVLSDEEDDEDNTKEDLKNGTDY
ncbi:MAG: prolipoprotein diacylglyceryl transferase [Ruminococcus sp.]|nr:prolipoprotein diacylglyceryl transferase [Ruminococcus sp.]MDE7099202.1 prolipoprotein diacylglyceryl transferase [Ruminococcus sp.]